MQKALVEMNLLLPRVVSDIVGKTGLTILRAVVAGEHDPQVLAQHRDPHCKATPDEIAGALTGPTIAPNTSLSSSRISNSLTCVRRNSPRATGPSTPRSSR